MAEAAAERERIWSALMVAAQDGDGRAYARLLREITPFVRAIAGRRSFGTGDIEDIVQDVLLTVHRVRQTYDPARPFLPWLASIAARRAIDAGRARGRRGARESFDPHAYETYADPAANTEIEAGEAAAEVAVLLASLPPRQREALELVKLRELSLAEASVSTGQSVGALKVTIHRAIARLRGQSGERR